ncbi:MAG TPA: hypothetical protein VIX89_20010 [Bryobacteraceae bacterium]
MARFNPQNLAIFMIATTQKNYIDDLLPETGVPDPNKNFGRLGVDPQVLDDFVKEFGGADRKLNREKFLEVARLAGSMVDYHPPDCPDEDTLRKIVDASR